MIVADTGAMIALVDADDQHHFALRTIYNEDPDAWVLPWAILPEVDYLLSEHVGARAHTAFLADLALGGFTVEWGQDADLVRARALCESYATLNIGLVDAVVAATAERLRATAIATIDLHDFAPLKLSGAPRLYPRDHVATPPEPKKRKR